MRAIEARSYGPPEVLALVDVPKADGQGQPGAHPGPGGHGHRRRLRTPAVRFPDLSVAARAVVCGADKAQEKIFGQEFAGEVEAVGKDVETLKPGDEIFANTGIGFGAWAEYKALPASGAIALRPANASFEEAACIPTGSQNALHFLRRANITPGKKVLAYQV